MCVIVREADDIAAFKDYTGASETAPAASSDSTQQASASTTSYPPYIECTYDSLALSKVIHYSDIVCL